MVVRSERKERCGRVETQQEDTDRQTWPASRPTDPCNEGIPDFIYDLEEEEVIEKSVHDFMAFLC